MDSNKKKILFVSARFPYPLHKGDQLVLFNNIKLVSREYSITLITMYDEKGELNNLDKIQLYCEEIITVKRKKIESYFNMFLSIFRQEPLQVAYYRNNLFKKTLNKLLKTNSYDLVHVYMLRIAHYAENISNNKVISLVDSMYLNMSRRVENETGIKKLVFQYETIMIKNYEKNMVNKFNKSIVVSEIDKKYIDQDNIEVVSIGINISESKAIKEKNKIIFTGNMGYFPNQNAIKWFVDNCFEYIKKTIPDVTLVIVGKNPPNHIKKLDDNKNIFVKGFVNSMSDELNCASIAIAPMQSGSGMQIKVLEAMSMGLPIVATSLGLGDISAIDNKSIVLADSQNTFIKKCIFLLQNDEHRKNIGSSAREFIKAEHSWSNIKNKYLNIYERVTN